MAVEVNGTFEPGFEAVYETFVENFAERDEVGAAFALYRGSEPLVDLWAGVADRDTGAPWERDTLGVVFSATKGLVAIAFLMLEDRGEIDLDATVGTYWPEFGHGSRREITVRQVLNHRSGLSAVDEPLTLEDFDDLDKVDAALARQEPLWEPGTAQGYGATAWGMYTQAIFRRVTGETLGVWLRRELFEPLNADVFLGLPREEAERVATLYPVGGSEVFTTILPKLAMGTTTEGKIYRRIFFGKGTDSARAFLNPSMGKERLNRMNELAVQQMELPWMNGIATARALARIYGALGAGTRVGRRPLVKKASLAPVIRKQSWTNCDRVLAKPLGYSQGFLKEEPYLLSPHEAAFGHTGAGGAVGFADPTHGIGVGYVMNRMDHQLRSPRCIALCRSVYTALEGWR